MGLADLGAFLQNRAQWQVQKPILQQQAADAHALAQSQIGEADLRTKAMQREWAKQNLTLDPSKVVSAANPPQPVDPITGDPAQSPADEAMPAIKPPAQALPDAEPLPTVQPPAPDSPEAIAAMTAPPPSPRPIGDSEVPGSTAGTPAPIAHTSPNLGSTAGAPAAPAAPAEPTLPPVDIQAPAVQPPKLQAGDLLTTSFYRLPPEAQDEILRQGHEQMKSAGFHITDQELIQHYNENQQRALPLLSPQSMLAGGMIPTKFSSEKGLELVNPGAGAGSGQPDNQQFHYDALTSQNVENKNFWPDDVIQKNQNTYAQHLIAAQQLQQVQNVLKRNPGVVGAVSGGKAGNLVRQMASALGYSGPYTDENTLRQWLADQMKTVMGSVSNVKNQMEFENLQRAISDPKWTVENWKDAIGRAGKALSSEHASLSDSFARHGLSPVPQGQTLPDVSAPTPSVSAPGGSTAENFISTKAEFEALPKGASFIWAPTGAAGRK